MAIVEAVPGDAGTHRSYALKNPATLADLGTFEVTPKAEVEAAIARAREAQPGWAALSFAERGAYFERALQILLERQDEYIDVIVGELGRARLETIMMEIYPACDSLAYYPRRAPKALADETRWAHGTFRLMKKVVMNYRPRGVVGIITPWNGPFILSLNPTVQALVAGNAVILKPSEATPYSGQLVEKLFKAAGLPENVLQVVLGDGETGAALVEGGVDKISFTGSVRTGRKIGEACGRNLVPCTLELGGKDAMIVCADADLDQAAAGAVFGAMINAGQVCMSAERIYVIESVYEAFTQKVVEKAKALRQSDHGEFEIGSIIWPQQLEVIERHVDEAKEKGATIHCGGRRNPNLDGMFYEPTVLTGVTHDMEIMREETFGPIIPIVPVKDEEEAIRLANDSDYGLSGSVFSKDRKRAIEIAKRIDTGSVSINDVAMAYGVPEAPFGGLKKSGVGQVNGDQGLRGYCHAQPIVVDRFTLPPEKVWYPYTEAKVEEMKKAMQFFWSNKIGRFLFR